MQIRKRERSGELEKTRAWLRRDLPLVLVLLVSLASPLAARCSQGAACRMPCDCGPSRSGERLTTKSCEQPPTLSQTPPVTESERASEGSMPPPSAAGVSGDAARPATERSEGARPAPALPDPTVGLFLLLATLLI